MKDESEKQTAVARELIYTPCNRAFFVYYVAILLCLLGPRINPEVGLPVWLGTLLGLLLIGVVVYMRYGQEYRITSRGVVKNLRWPSPRQQEITWANLGEVQVRRGLTQTLLKVGNLVLNDTSGGPVMFWFGLANPKEIKELIERSRP